MSFLARALTLGTLASAASPVLAAATPDQAKHLERSFAMFLGSDPKLVQVTPAGDAYAVHLDIERAVRNWITSAGVEATLDMSPQDWKMTPAGEGKWTVEIDQPLRFSFQAGDLALGYSVKSAKVTATYDEKAGYYNQTQLDYAGVVITETAGLPGHTFTIRDTIDRMTSQSTGSGAAAAVASSGHYTSSGFSETITLPPVKGGSAMPFQFTISAKSATAETSMQELNVAAITDLTAWLVAHPSRHKMNAGQSALRKTLRDGLPLFSGLHSTSLLSDVAIEAGSSRYTADQARINMDVTGLVADARFRERVELMGLHVPSPQIPAWAEALVPNHVVVDFALGGFDLLAPARLIADNIQPGKRPAVAASLNPSLRKAALPSGHATIELTEVEATAPLYHATATARLKLPLAQSPSAEATVQLEGLDAINRALLDAHATEALALVNLAGAAAKEDETGKLTWMIEQSQAGEVQVNGVPLTKILNAMH